MSKSFRVLARDGSELRPARAEVLHQWYLEGRLSRDSLISEKGSQNWRRLDEVFDLSTWERFESGQPSGIPNLEAKPPQQAAWDDDSRTSGMFAAAILLFVNAGVSFVLVAYVLLTPTPFLHGKEMVSPTFFWMSVPIMDLIVGIGLLRGKWQFRRFAMIRATAGVFFQLYRAWYFQSPGGWVELVFQVVFALGMFALLFGGLPSRERVFAGVVAVVVAWCGPASGVFVDDYLGYVTEPEPPSRNRPDPNSFVAQRHPLVAEIEDLEAGFKLTLPRDWHVRPDEDLSSAPPGTKMRATNSTAGCSAILRIDNGSQEVRSLDDYLNRLLTSSEISMIKGAPGERADVTIGNRIARRLETSWTDGLTPFRGFSTVCRDGARYILLSGWCEESVYEFAFPAFQELEAGFEFTAVTALPPKVAPKSGRGRSGVDNR